MPFKHIKSIFLTDPTNPLCTREQLIKACVLSKSTVVQDFEAQHESIKYTMVDFVEFLEIIGRLADVKAVGSNQESQFLHQKIEQILGSILDLADTQFKRPQKKVEVTYVDSAEIEGKLMNAIGTMMANFGGELKK